MMMGGAGMGAGTTYTGPYVLRSLSTLSLLSLPLSLPSLSPIFDE